MAGQAEVMERVAARVKQALHAADLDEYTDLLDPAVGWVDTAARRRERHGLPGAW